MNVRVMSVSTIVITPLALTTVNVILDTDWIFKLTILALVSLSHSNTAKLINILARHK